MKPLTGPAASLVLSCAVAACSDQSPSAPEAAPTALSLETPGQASVARPFRGSCDTGFTLIDHQDGTFDAPFDGDCRILHLGLTQVTAQQTGVFNLDGSTSTVATITYVAAGGDELHVRSTGQGLPPGPDLIIRSSFVQDILGGTGRFAGASGTASGELSIDLLTGTGEYSWAGSIVYDASDRRTR